MSAGDAITLVTGAAGFLGRCLVARLRAQGMTVRACVRPVEDAGVVEALGAEVVRADVTRPATLPALFDGGVTQVFHLAAICNLSTSYARLRDVNVDGVDRITALARSVGVRTFVHMSSTSVYGRWRGEPFTEDSPRQPADDYGRSKRDGEDVVLARMREGLSAVVLRPCTVYGPGCTDGAGKAFSRPTSIGAIPGSGRARLSNVRVEDVAGAATFLAGRPSAIGQVYNVADDSHPTIAEALTLAAEAFGAPPPTRHVPLPVVAALARVRGALAAWQGRIPDLEAAAVAYLRDDYVVDAGKLRAAGYRLLYPSFAESMRQLGRARRGEERDRPSMAEERA